MNFIAMAVKVTNRKYNALSLLDFSKTFLLVENGRRRLSELGKVEAVRSGTPSVSGPCDETGK